jgi:hypothetical protein
MGTVKDKDGNAIGYYHETEPGKIAGNATTITDVQVWQESSTPYPSTPTELVAFAEEYFASCVDIAKRKNARYAGPVDPFTNFRQGGAYGIAIRLGDKVARLNTLLHPLNNIDEDDETLEDTCKDIANYSFLLAGLRKNERKQ